jgi:propanediol dehydratase small subunit
MSKSRKIEQVVRRSRYEYRVWGKNRSARKQLESLSTHTVKERINDCYLIVDDTSWNAKVRHNTLKVKQLLEHDDGFQRWASGRHRNAESTPTPFDEIFEQLRLDRPQRGKSYDLRRAVKRLDPASGVRAVFVTKKRTRYSIGQLRAEVTAILLRDSGEVMHTLSIDGDDLDELTALRKRLGLRHDPNIAVHEAIETEISN